MADNEQNSSDWDVAQQIAAEFAREGLIPPEREAELANDLAERNMSALRWRALAERALYEEGTSAQRH